MFAAASKTASSSAPSYIEDVFSTYLYTGNGSSQTITNGIDLAGKGGLFWVKARAVAGSNGLMYGSGTELCSNSTNGLPASQPYTFGASGITFTGGIWSGFSSPNESGRIYASWTFRKQPKFFDVVTYTGTGNNFNNIVSHSLGSLPGFVVYKCTSTTSNWGALARNSAGNYETLRLNTTESSFGAYDATNAGLTSTTFNPGSVWGNETNASGQTYVAYLFAHNAGGFGTAGTDNVISCGSFTTNSSTDATVNLGYEPQWVLLKSTSTTGDWRLLDTMRGFSVNSVAQLFPNLSDSETTTSTTGLYPTATGFATSGFFSANQSFIYIAIRRGPMKTPTSGTSVFSPITVNAPANTQQTTNFPVDMQIMKNKSAADGVFLTDRLRGINSIVTSAANPRLLVNGTNAESSPANFANNWNNTGFAIPSYLSNYDSIFWSFRRAPSFFDEVCYTGTGSARTVSHNLGVAPELMIVKRRDTTGSWRSYSQTLGSGYMVSFNNSDAPVYGGTDPWNNTAPTSSVFSVSGYADVNANGGTYVAYLFASCPGVSKVGSYSGTGGTQTISCGFAARFVMIRRIDSTGDWWVWDTARGMVAGTDPRLAMNSSAAETNANWVYTDASGFQIVTTDATVNASGGSYIFLAVA